MKKEKRRGKEIITPGILYTLSKTGNNSIDLSREFEEFIDSVDNNTVESMEEVWGSIVKDLKGEPVPYFSINSNFSVDLIKKLKTILVKVNKSQSLSINLGNNSLYNEFTKDFIKLINDYNLSTTYLYKRNAINNSVVSRIKNIISAPSNYLIANEPVEVADWQDAAAKGLEVRGGVQFLLSSLDQISIMQQQKDASVGKDDVGIAANGLKVYFALTSYYNNHYSDPDYQVVDNDYKLFNKQFIMEGENYNISTLSDVRIRKSQIAQLEQFISKGTAKLNVFKSQAAISMSGFTSLATDNAKELAMAKLNASVQLASMHLYMLSIGIDKDTIAKFMNSKVAIDISKSLETNLFLKSDENDSTFVATILTSYEKTNGTSSDLSTFKSMYSGAQEFKMLSGFLKVNQKTSANIKELNKFLTNLETTMFSRENTIFGRDLVYLREFGNDSKKDKEFIDLIKLNNKTVSEAKIIEVLNNARDYKILGGQFDFREYIREGNTTYKQVVAAYYNLLKDTINVFDVIESVPHFKAMIDGVKISHNILNKLSKKYNFAFDYLRDIVRENTDELQTLNENLKHQMGNRALPIKIDDTTLAKALLAFDKFLVGK